MTKKKKISLYGVVEGDREKCFLSALMQLYQPRDNNISPDIDPSRGGQPNKIVTDVLKRIDRRRCFAWFDEDFEPNSPLSEEVRRHLATAWDIVDDQKADFLACPLKDLQPIFNLNNRKKPTLIISNPVSVESLILHALGRGSPVAEYVHEQRDRQIRDLKGALNSLIDASRRSEFEFYLEELNMDSLEERRGQLPELDLLISMITI